MTRFCRRPPVASAVICALCGTVLLAFACSVDAQQATQTDDSGRDFIMAVDLSGSMHGDAKRTVLRLTSVQLVEKLLEPGDNFCLLAFTKAAHLKGRCRIGEDKTEPLLMVTGLEPTTGGWTNIEAAKAKAIEQFQDLQASGNVKDRQQFLLLITDGEATHTLPSKDPLYSLWQRERDRLRKVVSFGKSGVALALFAYGAVVGTETAEAVAALAQDSDITRWMNGLRDYLKGKGGSLAEDLGKHQKDGLEIAPLDRKLVDGRDEFRGSEEGIIQRLVLTSDFEVGYAKGELKAGVTELRSDAMGSIPGNQVALALVAQGRGDSGFELSPHPRDEAEEPGGPRLWEQSFDLRIRLPQKRFPLSAQDVIQGTIEFTATGDLREFGGEKEDPNAKPLPDGLPVPSRISFVAERPQDTTATIVLAALIVLLVLGLGAALYMFGKPVSVRISQTGGALERTFRITAGQAITVGGPSSPMTYDLPQALGLQCSIRRTIAGKLVVGAIQGRLYEHGQPVENISITTEKLIGLGPEDGDAPEVELNVSLGGRADALAGGADDGIDWPT